MRTYGTIGALVLLSTAIGCVEKSSELTSAEREQLTEFVSREAPTPEHELDIVFEDKVKLLGYDISPATITPGEPVTITWHWKCERPLEEGWLLFTHVADAAGANRLNQDGDSPVRRLYQPGRWKAGEYVRDVQRITVPEDWNSEEAVFFLGIWNGPHRLQITHGPNDGENRARALAVSVEGSAAPPADPTPQVPALAALKTTEAINIDGQLSEEAWGAAQATGAFVNTMNGGRAEPTTTAKMLWDDANLYVAFDVADDFLKSGFEDHDDHLWEEDCVEIMIDPDGDGRNYFEMQVSPAGVVFDTRYEARRDPPAPGHVDWSSNLRAQVALRGTVNDEETDEGYTVEIAIPWTALSADETPATAPAANDTWRINFFVMDARGEGPQRAVAWSAPRVGDFHMLDRFGRVSFGETGAAPAGAAPMAVPPTPVAPAEPVEAIRLQPRLMKQLRRQTDLGGRLERAGPARPGPGEEAPTAENPGPIGL